eukprot:32785-Chlamydomonas_euryale.AAC.2
MCSAAVATAALAADCRAPHFTAELVSGAVAAGREDHIYRSARMVDSPSLLRLAPQLLHGFHLRLQPALGQERSGAERGALAPQM